MSQKYFTHATPTLFNAGTPRSQLSSCYLLAMKDDSIAGIYETLSDCAKISKWAGGIGLQLSERMKAQYWDQAFFIILLILIMVAVIDRVSRALREKLINE